MLIAPADPERHLTGILALCTAEGWPSWSDPDRVARVLNGAGALALVAVDANGRVTGFAHVLTDGEITAYLSLLVVHAEHRRRGIARSLMDEALRRCGPTRMDLLADENATGFYESYPHRRLPGYRIYPREEGEA